MSATIPVPIWLVVVVVVLAIVQHSLATYQLRLMRDLFRLYWKAQYDEKLP